MDDFLVACVVKGLNPAGELRRLVDAAEEPAEPDPGTMKQNAGEIDPVPQAADFLTLAERDGVPRLRFWRGTWLYWRNGAYREMPLSEVRGRLVDYLDQGYCKLTASAVGNVMEGLRAKARLPHHIDPPAWLGDNAPAWGLGQRPRLPERADSLAQFGVREGGLLAASNPAAVCTSGP